MTATDFSQSFLTFRIDTQKKPPQTVSHKPPWSLNNARIQIECRLEVSDKITGQSQSFVLGASCKTERVGVDRDIWTVPNADFAPVFSDTHFLHLKTYARAGEGVELYPPGSGVQSERQVGLISAAFDNVRIDLVPSEASTLMSAKEIVEATLANRVLNASTRIENDRYIATIEYPVKTMNANERDAIYQTDTGPVLFPDLSCEPDQMLTNLQLAYSAFNCADWIEFLVRVPTPVQEDIDVYHYSKSVHCKATNEVVCLT